MNKVTVDKVQTLCNTNTIPYSLDISPLVSTF